MTKNLAKKKSKTRFVWLKLEANFFCGQGQWRSKSCTSIREPDTLVKSEKREQPLNKPYTWKGYAKSYCVNLDGVT